MQCRDKRRAASSSASSSSHALQRSATEHSPAGSRALDPEIVLQKDPELDPTAVRIKTHHSRTPDVGIGILIRIPSYRAGEEAPEMIEYYGEYLGHGQSKTAFGAKLPRCALPWQSPQGRQSKRHGAFGFYGSGPSRFDDKHIIQL